MLVGTELHFSTFLCQLFFVTQALTSTKSSPYYGELISGFNHHSMKVNRASKGNVTLIAVE